MVIVVGRRDEYDARRNRRQATRRERLERGRGTHAEERPPRHSCSQSSASEDVAEQQHGSLRLPTDDLSGGIDSAGSSSSLAFKPPSLLPFPSAASQASVLLSLVSRLSPCIYSRVENSTLLYSRRESSTQREYECFLPIT
eukprot:scaffold82798_cov33-Tisochrysis_lutea.AAC.2